MEKPNVDLEDDSADSKKQSPNTKKKCFVIMPIADQDGYPEGHFTRVYKELIKPAIENAGFQAVRADDTLNTKIILLSILKSIVEYDMALCDLSSLNPNVMYELGVRQMAKMPVTLIKDERTRRIFDIQLMNDIPYDSSLRVDFVRAAQEQITLAIKATFEDRNSKSKSLLELLNIQLQIEETTVVVSKSEKMILDQLEGISRRLSKFGDIRFENSSQINDSDYGVWDSYGDPLSKGSLVYGPSDNEALAGNKFFFILQSVKLVPHNNERNRQIFVVKLFNLYSETSEKKICHGTLDQFVTASKNELKSQSLGQFESYERFNEILAG